MFAPLPKSSCKRLAFVGGGTDLSLGAPPAGLDLKTIEKSTTEKAKVIAIMKESFAHAKQAIKAMPDADLEKAARSLAQALASSSASALALTKQLFFQLDTRSLPEGIALGAKVNALARGTPDFRDAIARFLAR